LAAETALEIHDSPADIPKLPIDPVAAAPSTVTMSYEMTGMNHVGAHPFNHGPSSDAEANYERLRDQARQEASKRSSCLAKSQQAYASGDGGAAHALSEEGKQHGEKMAEFNKQASEYIFRENNANGRVAPDTIDLHGQFVEEAEDILEERIRAAQAAGQNHLHVIVGKGNHSPGHIQKIKPRVEQVCGQLGLQYHTEPNEGRIYVDLTGGAVDMSHVNNWGGYQQGIQNEGYGAGGGQQQGGYGGQQQQHYGGQQGGGGGQQHGQYDEEIKLAKRYGPRILRFLQKLLCNGR
jgi:DNA-nicking Smr family endonuclease